MISDMKFEGFVPPPLRHCARLPLMVGIWGLFWMFLFSYVMPDLKTVLNKYPGTCTTLLAQH